MRIIDRYLLRQFLNTFLICFFSLSGLIIVFDAFTNIEAFMNCAKGSQLLKLMVGYYAFRPIIVFDQTCSVITLMAAMFTVTWFQRHNEMTALMAAGISRIRILAPVIVAAIAILVLAAVNREAVMPRFRMEMSRQPGDLGHDAIDEIWQQRDNRTDVLIGGKVLYLNQQRIEAPNFAMPPGLRNYGQQLTADNAFFRAPAGDRPGGYLLEWEQPPKNLVGQPSLEFEGQKVLITPRDAAWLQPNQCFLVSGVPFEQLRPNGGDSFRTFASTGQLIASLRNRSFDFGADIRVAIHARIVKPFLDVALFFLGLPLVASRSSRNVFLAMGLCIGVVSFFSMAVIGFQQLGTIELLSPAFAAWAPLFLFVPAAVAMAEPLWER